MRAPLRLQFAIWSMRIGFRPPRAAFWSVGPRRLVVAVLERGEDEPILLRCAATPRFELDSASRAAPGVIELARRCAVSELPQIVALERPLAQLVAAGPEPTEELFVVDCTGVDAEPQLRVRAARETILDIVESFSAAGLFVASVDAADCARESLSSVLGGPPAAACSDPCRVEVDPLAAVTVQAQAEEDAIALGSELAVPIGLAVARFDPAEAGRAL